MPISNGSTVKIKTFVPEGTVVEGQYDNSSNEMKRLVEFEDADGETQQKWCLDSELEWVSDPAPEEEGE